MEDLILSYKKVIHLNPEDFASLFNLGAAFEKSNRTYEAISYYKKAIEVNPKYAKAYHNLGNILSELNNTARAAEYF